MPSQILNRFGIHTRVIIYPQIYRAELRLDTIDRRIMFILTMNQHLFQMQDLIDQGKLKYDTLVCAVLFLYNACCRKGLDIIKTCSS